MSNWKPAVIAAIVVGVVGIGAGILIGGDGDGEATETTETTTTVVQPVDTTSTEDVSTTSTTDETTEPDETTTTDETTTPDESTTEPAASGGPLALVDAVSENDLRSNQGDPYRQCVQAGGTGEIRGLGGESLTDPVVLEVFYSDQHICSGSYRIDLPVSDYSKLEIGQLGWADNVPAEATAEFSIYGDTIGSEPLFTDTSTGPGDTGRASLELAGIENLILEWKLGPPPKDEFEDFAFLFILDEAYVS